MDHSQTIGGDTAKLLGGYIPPFFPGLGTTVSKPTKSAHPNKLTVSIIPTLLSLPAMPTNLSCCLCLKTLPACLYYKQKTTLELQLCCGT